MVELRTMTEAEYQAYVPVLLEDYAADRARNLGESLESQRQEAERQIAHLLPAGVATPNHFLWRVTAQDGEATVAVGVLWVHVDPDTRRAFIYDIQIDEPYRGKGYGGAALRRLEEVLHAQGVSSVALNVFGDNPVAFHLYQRLGYYTVSSTTVAGTTAASTMQKDLQR